MMRDIIIAAFVQLLSLIKRSSVTDAGTRVKEMLSGFARDLAEPWNSLVAPLLLLLKEQALLEAIVMVDKEQVPQWCSSTGCYLLPDSDDPLNPRLFEVAMTLGMPVARVSQPLAKLMTDSADGVQVLSPVTIRQVLKSWDQAEASNKLSQLRHGALSQLMRVCTDDIRDEGDLDQLVGCWILVAADKSVHQLKEEVDGEEKLLLASTDEFDCFSQLNPGRLLRAVYGFRIATMMAKSALNVAKLGPTHFSGLLKPLLLPKYSSTPLGKLKVGTQFASVWLITFWHCCARMDGMDATQFLSCPLLATSNEECLVKLNSPTSCIVAISATSLDMPILKRFGCKQAHVSCNGIPLELARQIPALHDGGAADEVSKALYCSQGLPWCEPIFRLPSESVVLSNRINKQWTEAGITASDRQKLVIYLGSLPPVTNASPAVRQACQLLPLLEVGPSPGHFVAAAASEHQLYQPAKQFQSYYELSDADLVMNAFEGGAWYTLAGIDTMPLPQFVCQKVLPKLKGSVEAEQLQLYRTFVDALPMLLSQAPHLQDILADSECIVTEENTLAKPKDLYHPRAKLARDLVGPSAFPDPKLYLSDRLELFTRLGLRQEVNFKILLQIKAESITPSQAEALFKFVSTSAEELVAAAQHAEQLADVVSALSVLPFITVLDKSGMDWPGFPWRQVEGDVAARPVSPKDSRPRTDLLACSGTHFIAKEDVSPSFKVLVGWNKQPQPDRVIAHLDMLRTAWGSVTEADRDAALSCMNAAFGDVAHQLSLVKDDQAPASVNLLSEQDAWIWTGEGFVAAARVVINSGFSESLQPFIWTLDELDAAIDSSKPVLNAFLRRWNVREELDVNHIIAGLNAASIACQQSTSQADFVQSVQDSKMNLSAVQRAAGANSIPVPDVYQHAVALLTDQFFELGSKDSWEAGVPVLSSINHMIPANRAIFDDLDQQARGPSTYSFLHPSVTRDASKRLGVPSLTEFLTGSASQASNVTCPTVSELDELQKDMAAIDLTAIHPFFLHCVEAGDVFGASGVSLTLDSTHYPSTALMQPNYEALQGPALCITLHDVCLKPDELAQLLTPAGCPDAHVVKNRRLNGQGLAMAFDFAVAVVCVSGSTLTLFDPAGFYLPRQDADVTAGVGQTFNFAQTPILVSHFQNQFRPFYPHGLSPPQGTSPAFSKDTIIRVPLRTAPAPWLEDDAPPPTLQSMTTLLQSASCLWPHALAVSCQLHMLRMCFYEEEQLHTAFQATIAADAATLEARQQLVKMDNFGGVAGWMSTKYDPVSVSYSLCMTHTSWVAPALRREGDEPQAEPAEALEPTLAACPTQEQWHVVQQLGNAKARALAADIFSSTRLCPRVCASVRLTEDKQLVAPGNGTCFGAGCVFEAPLPVSLHATLFPFGTSTDHLAVRTRFAECSEFNKAQVASLANAYTTLLALLASLPPIVANPIKLYQWFWPQPENFPPGSYKPYLNAFYPELLNQLLKGEFFRMDGSLVKMKGGMVLARDTPSELRSYMAKKFPDCLQLPVEQVRQLRSADTGELSWLLFVVLCFASTAECLQTTPSSVGGCKSPNLAPRRCASTC